MKAAGRRSLRRSLSSSSSFPATGNAGVTAASRSTSLQWDLHENEISQSSSSTTRSTTTTTTTTTTSINTTVHQANSTLKVNTSTPREDPLSSQHSASALKVDKPLPLSPSGLQSNPSTTDASRSHEEAQPVSTRVDWDWVVGQGCCAKTSLLEAPMFPLSDKPLGASSGGEDAYFSTLTDRHAIMGVADGVGGWNALGVNPALFAWDLMEECQRTIEEQELDEMVEVLEELEGAEQLKEEGTDEERLKEARGRLKEDLGRSERKGDPLNVLREGYRRVCDKGKVIAGSSTACLVMLDRQKGCLNSANLGDSGFLVFRFFPAPASAPFDSLLSAKSPRGATHLPLKKRPTEKPTFLSDSEDEEECSTSSSDSFDEHEDVEEDILLTPMDKRHIQWPSVLPSHSSLTSPSASSSSCTTPRTPQTPSTPIQGGFRLIHQSQERQHYFNAPFQLSIIPSSVPPAQRMFFMADDPSDALVSSLDRLLPGDIIILGTDGLFDNMFTDELRTILESHLLPFYHNTALFSSSSAFCYHPHRNKQSQDEWRSQWAGTVQIMAQHVMQEAARLALSSRISPFGKQAQLNGWEDHFGGKVDDITVLAAIVLTTHEEKE